MFQPPMLVDPGVYSSELFGLVLCWPPFHLRGFSWHATTERCYPKVLSSFSILASSFWQRERLWLLMITSPAGFCSQWILDVYPCLEKSTPVHQRFVRWVGYQKPPTRLTVYSLSPKSWFSGKWQDIWRVTAIGRYTYVSLNHIDGEKRYLFPWGRLSQSLPSAI